ncbi:MAG: hypothetical protein ACI8O8_002561 [Oleiphilaceae bacterium]|jgi:hypothetical protein
MTKPNYCASRTAANDNFVSNRPIKYMLTDRAGLHNFSHLLQYSGYLFCGLVLDNNTLILAFLFLFESMMSKDGFSIIAYVSSVDSVHPYHELEYASGCKTMEADIFVAGEDWGNKLQNMAQATG